MTTAHTAATASAQGHSTWHAHNSMLESDLQLLNAQRGISVIFFDRVICFNEKQLENTLSPMLVTDSGIVMSLSFSHPKKAFLPKLVTVLGISMLVRLRQFWNARSSIAVIELGIVTLVRPKQSVSKGGISDSRDCVWDGNFA